MKKKQLLAVVLCSLLLGTLGLNVVLAQKDPFSYPDQIGDFGALQAGDEMQHGLFFSLSHYNFLLDENVQYLLLTLMVVLSQFDFDLARTRLDEVFRFLASLDKVTVNSLITSVTPPNSTYVGDVQGNVSVNIDYEALYDLLGAFYIINQTELSYADFYGNVTQFTMDLPMNMTILSYIGQMSLFPLIFNTVPLILPNNWTFWDDEWDYLDNMVDPFLTFENYSTVYHGIPVAAYDVTLNSSFILDFLFQLLGDHPIDNQSEYETWLQSLDNVTAHLWFHEASGVAVKYSMEYNMTDVLHGLEIILEWVYESTPIDEILIALEVIKALPHIGTMEFGFELQKLKYGGKWVFDITRPTAPDILGTLLTIGIWVAIIGAIAGGVAVVFFVLQQQGILFSKRIVLKRLR